jgi:cephalosporin hydroxylase
MAENIWHSEVPNDEDFETSLAVPRKAMGRDLELRNRSLELFQASRPYNFGYHLRWLGVPVIRLAEDLIRQQEIIFSLRPDLIIEIGVARGGGLIFNASMQDVLGITPRVIGIDNKFFPHTRIAIESSRYSDSISTLEADSDSELAIGFIQGEVASSTTVLLILDSDHSSRHVLSELRSYFRLLPIGSAVIVCDTIIDELPPGTFPDRTWADGLGPRHAVEQFLKETPGAELDFDATSDLLITEIRGGVVRKISG